ncbi:MAG: ligand-gated channel [Devosia sp.]|nr:ligand-gated channel [Devosia sp.]
MGIEGHGETSKRKRAHRGIIPMLLGCTALAGLAPGVGLAQESAGAGSTLALPVITIEGQAQDGDDDRASIVARTTTSGSKLATPILDTPATVSVVTAKEIERRDAETTEEVLQYTPGVVTDFYGSDGRFDYFKIRGLDAFAYRDGLGIGRPFLGVREEPYAFERVEVVKGANSTAFGLGDPGGSVNYVTKTPRNEQFGEVYVTGGSFGRGEIGGDFGDNITADETLSYRLTGKLRLAGDEYDYANDDEAFAMGGLTWRPSDATKLTVVYDHLRKRYSPNSGGHPVGTDFDRDLFFGEPDFNYATLDRDTVSLMFDHDFGSGLTFSSNARYSNSSDSYGYAYISGPTAGTVAARDFVASEGAREHFIVDGRLQYETSFGDIDSRSLVGVEHNDDQFTSKGFYGAAPGIDWTDPVYTGAPKILPIYADAAYSTKGNAIYLQQELTFSDALIATVGVRNDWLDLEQTDNLTGTTFGGDFSEFTKRAGLVYKFTPEVSGFVSYAESAVPAAPYGTPVTTLAPERGQQWEVGVKYQPEAYPALFTASLFTLSKDNITVTVPGTPPTQETLGEVSVSGIDLEAKAELMENLTVTAAYSYMMSEIVEDGATGNAGNQLSRVPNHLASLWVDYTIPSIGSLGEITLGAGARYTGAYFIDDANTTKADAAIIFDAALNYEIQENTTLQLNVSNIFDEKHAAQKYVGGFGATFYNPGRTISATLKQSW